MDDMAPWVAGVLAALLALFGLVLASGAEDLPFQVFGFALFAAGLAGVFGLITSHTRAPVPPPSGAEGETDDLTRPTREGDGLIAAAEAVRGDADPGPDPRDPPRQPAAIASRA